MKNTVLDILSPTFKGTLIEDPVLEPYFIVAEQGGGFTINRKREDKNGNLRFSAVCYPSSFMSCLETIAKEKLHESGKSYTVAEYIDSWKKISSTIINAYKDWNINKI